MIQAAPSHHIDVLLQSAVTVRQRHRFHGHCLHGGEAIPLRPEAAIMMDVRIFDRVSDAVLHIPKHGASGALPVDILVRSGLHSDDAWCLWDGQLRFPVQTASRAALLSCLALG